MNPQDDWAQWGESWRRQPTADIQRLRLRVERKRRRMLAVVALEWVVSCLSVVAVVSALLSDQVELRWKIAATGSLALVALLLYLGLHVRRGTWRASADSVQALLQLTMRRARAGIRLAWIQMGATLLVATAVLLLALPDLQPASWQHDAKLRLILVVQFAANTPVVLATLAFCVWYIRRQRRRIERIASLLDTDRDAAD